MATEPSNLRPIKGRTPPHDTDAEAALLGAMLLGTSAVDTALGLVSADDFYTPAHGHIFAAIAEGYAAGESVDPISVAATLKARGLLEAAGGAANLVTLQAAGPPPSASGTYARIIAEHARRRRMLGLAAEVTEAAYAGDDEALERTVSALSTLPTNGRARLLVEDVSEPGPSITPTLLWMREGE